MNKDIKQIIRIYLLPDKFIIKKNKDICLHELKKETNGILLDLNIKRCFTKDRCEYIKYLNVNNIIIKSISSQDHKFWGLMIKE